MGLYALEKSEKVILQSKILLGGAAWLWQNIMPVQRAVQKNGMQAVPMLLLLCNLGFSLKRSEWSLYARQMPWEQGILKVRAQLWLWLRKWALILGMPQSSGISIFRPFLM